MKKIIFLLLVCYTFPGFSQTYDREWATYFGDSSLWISGIAEHDGNLFIVGKTTNSSYTETLTSSAPFQPDYGGGATDGFFAKISEEGQLLWFSYYGGEGDDEIIDIIIYADILYLVGKTSSDELATSGVHQDSLNGIADGFIASFDLDGNRNWHTYFGGEKEDEVISLVIESGKIVVHGRTSSHTAIATSGAFQETIHPEGTNGDFVNNFIAAFTTSGTKLWGTYYGLTNNLNSTSFGSHLFLTGIAANKTGFYISGWDTQSANNTYYGTPGSFMETRPGPVPMSLYLSKFDNEGNRVWSTYYNAVDANGNSTAIQPYGGAGYLKTFSSLTSTNDGVYISGRTIGASVGTQGSFQPTKTGVHVPFVQNFSNTGERLWGSYLGNGYGTDVGGGYFGAHLNGLSKDSENNIYIAGSTHSIGDIATPDGFQTEKGNFTSCFVAKMTPGGTTKIYGTYYGSEQSESDGKVIPIGNGDSFYLIGSTSSTAGIATPGAWQENFISGGEVEKNIFIVKFTDEELLHAYTSEKMDFVLYPNPVKDYLHIQSLKHEPFEISIFNIAGQQLLGKRIISPSAPLDLSALPAGMYIAQIKDSNGKMTEKMKLMKL
ncbi:MAG TPA: T9SS type A sorting domain-containing protein [Flavobacteriaceae bacterium]|nr:T9SS type A sorting domain-containing protein [Flavobacteriaceae bacterium]